MTRSSQSLTFARRPIKSRDTHWAQSIGTGLARMGVRPNAISAASVGASMLAGVALLLAPTAQPAPAVLLYAAAALCIQLRLLCNLFDGLVAVEGGRHSRAGGMWNELPDRFSDGICLVCAGAAAGLPTLGWLAAFLAAVTAYVRTLGASLGLAHSFVGPMAKQHRMAALTAGVVLAALESVLGRPHLAIGWALVVIVVGTALTIVRRVRAIERDLR
ncbi:MAG: CDP-alcohol phosphatidyltransferase family protein [Actinomycetota bacterium]